MDSKNIRERIASGAVTMTGLMLAERILSFISTLILARLLIPEDFGVVAMCMSIVAALELFTAFGFDVYLIQNQDADQEYYDTAWTLRILVGAFIAIAIALSAIPTSIFYDESRVIWPMYIIAISSFLRGFENIGVVDFRKDLKFGKEVKFRFAQRLFGFVVTIPLAYLLRNHWALVIGMITINMSAVALSYKMSPRRPRFSLKHTREIMGFSSWLLLNNSMQFLQMRTPIFLIGRTHGAADLGLYQMSRDISGAITSQLVASANRAIFPGYSKVSAEDTLFVQMFLNVVAATALFALPVGIGLAYVAPAFVDVILGPEWVSAGPVIQLLALTGALTAIQSNCGYIFHAKGRPRITTTLTAVNLTMLLPALFYVVPEHGLMGAATVLVSVAVIYFPIVYIVTLRFLGLPMSALLKQLARPVAAAGAMAGVLYALYPVLYDLPAYQTLIASVMIGGFTYVATLGVCVWLFASDDSVEKALLARFRPA